MKISGIYGIFDAESDCCLYVGQSKDIHARWRSHVTRLSSGTHRRKDFVIWFWSHGSHESALNFRVLEYCKPKDLRLNEAEVKWFNMLSPLFYGKRPSTSEKWEHSEVTKARIAKGVSSCERYSNVSPIEPRACVTCSSVFTPSKRSAKFCSRECVSIDFSQLIRDRGYTPRCDLNSTEVIALYQEIGSLRKVARVAGVSHITIRKVLIENGVALR